MRQQLKKLAFLAPKPGTTDQAFVQHWREVHGPIVALTPGYAHWRWRYVQNHVRGPGPVGTDFPYRGMAAFWLPGDCQMRTSSAPRRFTATGSVWMR